jgi:hypothetical protein
MSFREKIAWISLVATVVVYGGYFASLTVPASGGGRLAASFGLLVGATVLFIIAMIVLTVFAAVLAPRDAAAPPDEREKLISLKASQFSYFALSSGAFTAIVALFVGTDRFFTANFLFFALVVSEIAKDAAQIVYFRRGA